MSDKPLKNQRHELFAQHLAAGKTADEAYKLAGFKPNRGNATTLKAKQSIQARVAAILKKGADRVEVSVESIVRELARIGFSDIRKAFHPDGRPKLPGEWDDDFAAAVTSLEVVTQPITGGADEDQEPQGHGGSLKRNRGTAVQRVHKFKTADKRAALVDLGRYKGMFKEDASRSGDIHLHFDGLLKGVL